MQWRTPTRGATKYAHRPLPHPRSKATASRGICSQGKSPKYNSKIFSSSASARAIWSNLLHSSPKDETTPGSRLAIEAPTLSHAFRRSQPIIGVGQPSLKRRFRSRNPQASDILGLVPITILYVILGISTAALVAVGTAVLIRIRRLSRASRTQFQRALEEESGEQPVAVRPEDSQVTS